MQKNKVLIKSVDWIDMDNSNNLNNSNNSQFQSNELQAKLDKMRIILTDEARCKEIAQKLCAYISSNS